MHWPDNRVVVKGRCTGCISLDAVRPVCSPPPASFAYGRRQDRQALYRRELHLSVASKESLHQRIVLHGGPGFTHDYLADDLLPLADAQRVIDYDPSAPRQSKAPSELTV
jgi:hypothetical protein